MLICRRLGAWLATLAIGGLVRSLLRVSRTLLRGALARCRHRALDVFLTDLAGDTKSGDGLCIYTPIYKAYRTEALPALEAN